MKKMMLVTILMGLLLSAGAAFALPAFNFYNPATGTQVAVDTLDWSSSGTGVAVGLGPFGTPIDAGDEFEFYYQAALTAANLSGQTVFNSPVNGFEYTIVSKFDEVVLQGAAQAPGTAIFGTTGGSFYIYYGSANANVSAGTGFDDGALVASGSILPYSLLDGTGYTTFTAFSATSGIGVATIAADFDFINPLYMSETGIGGYPYVNFAFQGTVNYPPLDSITTVMFAGGDDTNYPTYTIQLNDLILKSDSSSTVNVVPEPSTIFLLGVGLIGLVGLGRKRMK